MASYEFDTVTSEGCCRRSFKHKNIDRSQAETIAMGTLVADCKKSYDKLPRSIRAGTWLEDLAGDIEPIVIYIYENDDEKPFIGFNIRLSKEKGFEAVKIKPDPSITKGNYT